MYSKIKLIHHLGPINSHQRFNLLLFTHLPLNPALVVDLFLLLPSAHTKIMI